VEVYTDYFSDTTVDWTEGGSSPYLDDDDGHYIYTTTTAKVESYWTFPAGTISGTINSVKIRFEALAAGANNKFQSEVWDGAAWVDMGLIDPTGMYAWYEVDVSATLNTWAKINGCRIRVTSNLAIGTPLYVRRLTRKVDYIPMPTMGMPPPKISTSKRQQVISYLKMKLDMEKSIGTETKQSNKQGNRRNG